MKPFSLLLPWIVCSILLAGPGKDPGQIDDNPFAAPESGPPEISVRRGTSSEKLMSELENLSQLEPKPAPAALVQAATDLIGSAISGRNGGRVDTIPQRVAWWNEAAPVGVRIQDRENRGLDIGDADKIIRQLPQERLAGLDPHVAVPVLALASLDTLRSFRQKIPAGSEKSRWSQMVNFAEVHKATMVVNRGRVSEWGKWADLANLVVAIAVMAKGRDFFEELIRQTEAISHPAIIPLSAAGILFGMATASYGARWRDGRARRADTQQKEKARVQLQEATRFAKNNDLPFYSEAVEWGTKYNNREECFGALATLVEDKG